MRRAIPSRTLHADHQRPHLARPAVAESGEKSWAMPTSSFPGESKRACAVVQSFAPRHPELPLHKSLQAQQLFVVFIDHHATHHDRPPNLFRPKPRCTHTHRSDAYVIGQGSSLPFSLNSPIFGAGSETGAVGLKNANSGRVKMSAGLLDGRAAVRTDSSAPGREDVNETRAFPRSGQRYSRSQGFMLSGKGN